MCKSNLTVKRYCKVLFESYFYILIFYFIFLIFGYETISLKRIYDLIFFAFRSANGSGRFVGSFLIFYLFIPFMNKFVESITKIQYKHWILFLLFVFTGLSTFFFNTFIFGEVFWFCAVYFIGGYLRLYPPKWSENIRSSARLLLYSVIIAWLSVLLINFIQYRTGISRGSNWFVSDANKLGAVLVSVFLFSAFKNIPIGYNNFINLIAKTTFGILLIHANSDAMRQWLWQDLLHVDTSYGLPVSVLIARTAIICICVFIVCSLIDMIRLVFIEKPVFEHFDSIEKLILRAWNWFKKVLYFLYHLALRIAS